MPYLNKYICISLGLTLLYINSVCQEKSLSKGYYKREPSISIMSLIDSASVNIQINPQKSFGFIEQALIESIQSKNNYTEALSYQILGKLNQQINQYDLANGYYKKAIPLFEHLDRKNDLFQTYIDYAGSLYKNNETKQSIDLLEKSLSFYKSINYAEKVSIVKEMLADIYNQTGNNSKALALYKDVLSDQEQAQNQAAVIEVQQKIGKVYLDEEKSEEAINTFNESEQMARKLNDNQILANTLQNKSKAYRKVKKYDEELEVRRELQEINVSQRNIPAQAENKLEMGDIYLELEKPNEAEKYFKEGISLTEKTGNLEQQSIALKKLSLVYDQKKEYDKALETYKNYVALVDNIHARQKEEIQASIILYANINRKLERLDMLEKDYELNKKSGELLIQEQLLFNKELKVQRLITYSLLIVLFILTLATLLIYRSALNKRKANQLMALKTLRSQMNPHFIYNSLNSINQFIAKNNEREANKYLSSFSRLMRTVMDNSKHDFVPLSSELEIIKLYLELEHTRFPEKFEYTLNISQQVDADFFNIPPMLIQPYIENAIWHGLRYKEEKGLLKISIDIVNENLQIIIEDNGIGRKKSEEMKTKHQKLHISSGLKNIENRIEIIQNIFQLKIYVTIEDLNLETHEGTKVTIMIPKTK